MKSIKAYSQLTIVIFNIIGITFLMFLTTSLHINNDNLNHKLLIFKENHKQQEGQTSVNQQKNGRIQHLNKIKENNLIFHSPFTIINDQKQKAYKLQDLLKTQKKEIPASSGSLQNLVNEDNQNKKYQTSVKINGKQFQYKKPFQLKCMEKQSSHSSKLKLTRVGQCHSKQGCKNLILKFKYTCQSRGGKIIIQYVQNEELTPLL